MCGIAGYHLVNTAAGSDPRVSIAMALLAVQMESRGSQSWGTMSHSGRSDSPIMVQRVAASVLASFRVPIVSAGSLLPMCWAVHTRHATTGKVKPSNAHPFCFSGSAGEIVGMHNGIIDNYAELAGLYPQRRCRVDSEHIFAHMADGAPLRELEGYGAIVYSRNAQEWFIGRFNCGEMSAVVTDLGVFFASTQDALWTALRVANIPVKQVLKLKDNKLYQLSGVGLESAGKLDIGIGWGTTWQDNLDSWKCAPWHDSGKPTTKLPDKSVSLSAGALINSANDVDSIPMQMDRVTECDLCGIDVPAGEHMYWLEHEHVLVCEDCKIYLADEDDSYVHHRYTHVGSNDDTGGV